MKDGTRQSEGPWARGRTVSCCWGPGHRSGRGGAPALHRRSVWHGLGWVPQGHTRCRVKSGKEDDPWAQVCAARLVHERSPNPVALGVSTWRQHRHRHRHRRRRRRRRRRRHGTRTPSQTCSRARVQPMVLGGRAQRTPPTTAHICGNGSDTAPPDHASCSAAGSGSRSMITMRPTCRVNILAAMRPLRLAPMTTAGRSSRHSGSLGISCRILEMRRLSCHTSTASDTSPKRTASTYHDMAGLKGWVAHTEAYLNAPAHKHTDQGECQS